MSWLYQMSPASPTFDMFDFLPIFLFGSSKFCFVSLWELVLITNWFEAWYLRMNSFKNIMCPYKTYHFPSFAQAWLIPSKYIYPISISSSSSLVYQSPTSWGFSFVASYPIRDVISIVSRWGWPPCFPSDCLSKVSSERSSNTLNLLDTDIFLFTS